MKIFHLYDPDANMKIPTHIREQNHIKIRYAAIDGYVRPRCTSIVAIVDCKLCLKEMKKQGYRLTKTQLTLIP